MQRKSDKGSPKEKISAILKQRLKSQCQQVCPKSEEQNERSKGSHKIYQNKGLKKD